MTATILSLFDYSGNWSKPYEDAGYNVIRVDAKHGDDVRLWPSGPADRGRLPREFADIRDYDVHGILCAPPCTVFSGAGAKHPRDDQAIREGLETMSACFRIAYALRPAWFALENPVGKLSKWIGDPIMRFNPCDYGDPYTKRTCLWGWFNTDLPKNPVEPERVCAQGSWVQKLGGKSERTKELRSMTPMGFARAFFQANP